MYRYYRVLCITTAGEYKLSPYSVWSYNIHGMGWGHDIIAIIIPNKLPDESLDNNFEHDGKAIDQGDAIDEAQYKMEDR